jgi:adenosylcobyric acid synthase
MASGRARVLMVQGTASHVGKSLLVSALCRWFADRGVAVAPFKAQNMSLNAGVTPDGAEIGRAQLLQARAARAVPTAAMNPILLKPETEQRSQVVVRGRAEASRSARDYFAQRDRLWPVVVESLEELRREYDLVIAEGAGSPAEINLRDRDIVNMAVALHAAAPVLLVGDIERGGVFAALAGTLQLLSDAERRLVRGIVINKFRGDVSLVEPGPAMLEARTGVPTLGVVPWLPRLSLPEEDALPTEPVAGDDAVLDIAVVAVPHLSNFDDFDPLRHRPGVRLRFEREARCFGRPDLVILPGSKTTVDDLRWLRENGFADRIRAHRAAGRPVLGVCGGFQMLGRAIHDPCAVESNAATTEGLALLDHVTDFHPVKHTRVVGATIAVGEGPFGSLYGLQASGYELRMGRSTRPGIPFARVADNGVEYPDGGVDAEGLVLGTYLHGLLHSPPVREALLASVARISGRTLPPAGPERTLDSAIDRWTAHIAQHVDLERVARWVELG